MKFNYLWTGFLIAFIVAIPLVLGIFIMYLPDFEQPPTVNSIQLNGPIVIDQFFTSDRNNLSAIGMSIKNPYLANKKNLSLKLIDANGDVVRSVSINGNIIQDGDFVKIRFEPILDSKDKKYSFELSTPETHGNESLAIMATTSSCKSYGEMLVNGEKSDETLAFVPYYSPQNRLFTSIDIYEQVIKRLVSDLGFFVVYILILGFSFAALISIGRKNN